MKIPVCPHCKHKFTDDETWQSDLETGNDDTTDMKCPACDTMLHIRCEHIPDFYLLDDDGDEIR